MAKNKPIVNAQDFPPEVFNLFDKYVHGDLDRRAFLRDAAKFAIGGMTAVGLLNALSPQFAHAQQIAHSDARIKAQYIEFDSPLGYGKGRGYLVSPADLTDKTSEKKPTDLNLATALKKPTVLVVHENRGLNPHIEDIARRVALEGFIAFAPDALFPLGGYPGDEDKARELFPQLDQTKTQQDFIAALNWLNHHAESNGKVGVVGFCYGGAMANLLATRVASLNAAVPFYGSAPPLDQVANIKAPLMLHFAEKDDRVNASWPAYEAALKKANIPYQAYQYANTQHGFNNDTTPRYDDAAAKLAWQRTIAFFNQNLR